MIKVSFNQQLFNYIYNLGTCIFLISFNIIKQHSSTGIHPKVAYALKTATHPISLAPPAPSLKQGSSEIQIPNHF